MSDKIGIGCDIESVDRFKGIVDNKHFLSNVFTPKEISCCLRKDRPELHLARKFAAKEAIFKALSSLNHKVPLKHIEILNNEEKTGTAKLRDRAVNDRYRMFVSVSDAGRIVFASAVARDESNKQGLLCAKRR